MQPQIIKVFFILFILTGCDNADLSKQHIEFKSTGFTEFPYFKLDTVYDIKPYRIIEVTDEKPYLNPVTLNQMFCWYSFHLHEENNDYDSIKFIVHMPNRDSETIEQVLISSEITQMQKTLKNSLLENFFSEYVALNLSTKEKYKALESLISHINISMALVIEKEFKDDFPESSTWNGFDSFQIFEMYFTGIVNEEYNHAGKIIESVINFDERIFEEDKVKLHQLITKYQQFIESTK